jgi:alpha-beta hydrolase superfamily lysophospholipase
LAQTNGRFPRTASSTKISTEAIATLPKRGRSVLAAPAQRTGDDDGMESRTLTFEGRDGVALFARCWSADGQAPGAATAAVEIAHGMGEHSARYARFAEALVAAGYVAYAYDHRGHGHTVHDASELGHFGAGGWNALVDDMRLVGEQIDAETGGLPRAVFAHSMGSFALQQLLLDHSDTMSAAILSGTSAVDALAGTVPADDSPTDLTAFNAPFEPARTEFDWLSRDPAEVDKYVADPLCGFGVAGDALRGMAVEAPRAADVSALAQIRKDLPLLMISGSDDPLAGGLALVDLVAQRYRDAGLTDVTTNWYDGARHELLNETNRDEVTADVIAWLGHHIS